MDDGISSSRRRHRIQSIIVIPPPPPPPSDPEEKIRKRRRKTDDGGTDHPAGAAGNCKEEEEEEAALPVIFNIPDDVITEILSRLPAKHVLRFKSVCRPWLSLISQPTFVNTHLRRNINQYPSVFLLPFFHFKRHQTRRIYDEFGHLRFTSSYLGPDDPDDLFHEASILTHTAPPPPPPPPPPPNTTTTTASGHDHDHDEELGGRPGKKKKKEFPIYSVRKTRSLPLYFAPAGRKTRSLHIMGSCHGFICICVNKHRLVLFNPSTRVHLKLPPCLHNGHAYRRCFFAGIGYDSSTCHYKVLHATVRGFHHDGRGRSSPYSNIPPISGNSYCNVEVHILTLNNNSSSSSSSSRSWRKIRGIDNVYYVQRHSCVYSNGSLHWLICKRIIDANHDDDPQGGPRFRNSILSFDLADETFGEMAVPEDVVTCSLSRRGKPDERERLGCLGGDRLAFSYCFPLGDHRRPADSSRGVIWIMKEYNNWTKLTTFPLTGKLRSYPTAVIPLCFLEEEEEEEARVVLLIQEMLGRTTRTTELVSLSLIDHSFKKLDILIHMSAAAAIYVDTLVSSHALPS